MTNTTSPDQTGQTAITETTPQDSQVPARVRKVQRRKIDASDIIAIAKLVAKGLTETQSCHRLEIDPNVFFHFKARGKNDIRFASLLEKAKSARIDGLLDEIEKIGHGVGMKAKDWRALDRLLVITDKRFSDRVGASETNVNTSVNFYAQIGLNVPKLIADGFAHAKQQQAALTVASEVKQLPETTGSETEQKETP